MNISSDFFNNDKLNSSDLDSTEVDFTSATTAINTIIILSCFPTNLYVIWLIVRGRGNRLAAEFFSLNLAVCETLFGIESVFKFLSYKAGDFLTAGSFLNLVAITARPLFQCMICVERYLAVVHPVTFLKYKPLRYRVICCAIAWVIIFASSGIHFVTHYYFFIDLFFIFLLVHFSILLSAMFFCCLAVLRALKQSGPGENRAEENHMKRRAFYLILLSTMTMLIIFFPYIILLTTSTLGFGGFVYIAFVCFVYGGLVQPLLFLYRVRKPSFIKCQ